MGKKTIGILLDSLFNAYEAQIWQDVIKIARDKDLNLICYALRKLQPAQKGKDSSRILYQMINDTNLDGVIVFSNTLGNLVSIEELVYFFKSFAPLPVVSLGVKIEGFPAVTLNNQRGMRQLLAHLFDTHGCKKPAFIKGPPGNWEAEIRLQIYREMLAEYNLDFRPEAVVSGNFLREAGAPAVAELLDKRKVSFDALISCNDYMALSAIRELQHRGLRVPDDVAVTGFDDIIESRCGIQPLTTVRQPVYELARSAIELLLSILAGKADSEEIVLPAIFTVRRSCGCFMHSHANAKSPRPQELHSGGIGEQKVLNTLIRKSQQQMQKYFQGPLLEEEIATWADKLVNSLSNTMGDRKNEKSFFLILENIILNSVELGIEALQWYPVVSVVFEGYKKVLPEASQSVYLGDLWKEALTFIGNIADYRFVHTNVDYREMNIKMHTISEALKNVYDINKLTDIIATGLQELGIRRFFFTKYVVKKEIREVGKILIAYDENGIIPAAASDFPIQDILPERIKYKYSRMSLIVLPLWYKEIPFGYVVFEIGRLEGSVFESITQHLNNSLQGANRFNLVKQQTLELETKATLQTHLLESTRKKIVAEQMEKERTIDLLRQKEQQILALQKKLEHQSKLDNLTRLFNRDALFSLLKKEIKRTRRNLWRIDRELLPEVPQMHKPSGKLRSHFGYFSIILLNIDDFKQINEQYGPKFGDQILITLGELLQNEEIFRQEDIPCRFSGKEFITILPNTNEINADNVARRLCAEIAKLRFGEDVVITVSIGIAEYSPGAQNTFSIIHNAEQALAYAKEHGKNRIVLYGDLKKR